jgi:hypothetical protein
LKNAAEIATKHAEWITLAKLIEENGYDDYWSIYAANGLNNGYDDYVNNTYTAPFDVKADIPYLTTNSLKSLVASLTGFNGAVYFNGSTLVPLYQEDFDTSVQYNSSSINEKYVIKGAPAENTFYKAYYNVAGGYDTEFYISVTLFNGLPPANPSTDSLKRLLPLTAVATDYVATATNLVTPIIPYGTIPGVDYEYISIGTDTPYTRWTLPNDRFDPEHASISAVIPTPLGASKSITSGTQIWIRQKATTNNPPSAWLPLTV